jgi:hypothetical protein
VSCTPDERQDRKNQQNSSVDGHDSKEAPSIKDVKIVGRPPSVEKYPPDEKTRENEEEINTTPCKMCGDLEVSKCGAGWCLYV